MPNLTGLLCDYIAICFLINYPLTASVSWIRPEDSTDHISVHSGFIEQYDSVREDLWEITNQRLELFPNTSEIFIAGHSMGGALTTLCTLDFCYNKSRLDRPELKGNIILT